MKIGDVAVIISDNTRFFKGDRVKILGYSKTFNQYYVQRLDGQICAMVDKEDLKNV